MTDPQSPPTRDEYVALMRAILAGERPVDDLAEHLDTDRFFAGCSVDDLDPVDVETVVRWTLRQYVTKYYAPMLDDDTDLDVFNRLYPIVNFGRGDRHGICEFQHNAAAIGRLLDQLRAINEGRDV